MKDREMTRVSFIRVLTHRSQVETYPDARWRRKSSFPPWSLGPRRGQSAWVVAFFSSACREGAAVGDHIVADLEHEFVFVGVLVVGTLLGPAPTPWCSKCVIPTIFSQGVKVKPSFPPSTSSVRNWMTIPAVTWTNEKTFMRKATSLLFNVSLWGCRLRLTLWMRMKKNRMRRCFPQASFAVKLFFRAPSSIRVLADLPGRSHDGHNHRHGWYCMYFMYFSVGCRR